METTVLEQEVVALGGDKELVLAVTEIVPEANKTIFDMEREFAALLDFADSIPPEEFEKIEGLIVETLSRNIAKRDRVWLDVLKSQNNRFTIDAIIEWLKDKKEYWSKREDRSRRIVERTIRFLGTDAKGRWTKLEGTLASWSLRKCPDKLLVTDLDQVPVDFQIACVEMPLSLLDTLLDRADSGESIEDLRDFLIVAATKAKRQIDEKSILAAIAANVDVPGVDVSINNYSLQPPKRKTRPKSDTEVEVDVAV